MTKKLSIINAYIDFIIIQVSNSRACEKIREYLKITNPQWNFITIEDNIQLKNIEPLFNRI